MPAESMGALQNTERESEDRRERERKEYFSFLSIV
ncbi:unnamed protein product [Spirodela intermedia]|uniref:Uncharacterized protein n=1 Tax=Spirodela intermedia TaxID=51605 RepID=A0A7I8JY63_SPIIN|nr:unnamed protein product [Spirodela intermedia]